MAPSKRRQIYEVIVFDTPPFNDGADMTVPSHDDDLLVIVAGVELLANKKARRAFQAMGATVLAPAGVIVDGDIDRPGYGYRYRYPTESSTPETTRQRTRRRRERGESDPRTSERAEITAPSKPRRGRKHGVKARRAAEAELADAKQREPTRPARERLEHEIPLREAEQAEAAALREVELREAERREETWREADRLDVVAREERLRAGRPDDQTHDAPQRDASHRAGLRRAAELHAAEQREAERSQPTQLKPLLPNRELGERELRELEPRKREPGEQPAREYRYFSLTSTPQVPRSPDVGDRRRRGYRPAQSAPVAVVSRSQPASTAPTARSSEGADHRVAEWPQAAERELVLRTRLRDIARAQPGWGHRLAWGALLREGWKVDRKEIRALWRDEGLQGPRHRPVEPKAVGSFTGTTAYGDPAWEDDERTPRNPPPTSTPWPGS